MNRRLFLQTLAASAFVPAISRKSFADSALPQPWKTQVLFEAPQTYAAPGFEAPGVQSLFFEGPAWEGKPTRVFAWMGMPKHKPAEKVPGIVLVHGGGATAYANWVRLWNSRGYAAIAMDTCGSVPGETRGLDMQLPRHEMGGPPGWGGFTDIDLPIQDQWPYHAVATVLLAHSLLRVQPAVDANRIGMTGMSWGGYLACIAAGIDPRFKFAVPVYGCGFLGDDSIWLPQFRRMGDDAKKWLGLWDPSQYVGRAQMPFLWVDGTNDFAYPMSSLQKTYRLLPAQQRTLSIHVRMAHGHGGPGENPEEIRVFADSIVCGGRSLTHILKQTRNRQEIMVGFEPHQKIVAAQLNFTKDLGRWEKRHWETAPAQLDIRENEARAILPPDVTTYFLNLVDEQNCAVSSEHEELKPDNPSL
jgi:cephalosporin-C deacetylase-like acetyl esterase